MNADRQVAMRQAIDWHIRLGQADGGVWHEFVAWLEADELHVAIVLTGHFLQQQERLLVTLEATEVNSDKLLWQASLTAPSQDFIGVNYYTRELVKFNRHYRAELFGERVLPAGAPRSDLNWEIYPEGLHRTLRSLRGEGLPIFVTENGIADAKDAMRPAYLLAHLTSVQRAITDGAPVRGYFHWTSLDNFERAEGYSAKFGLIACDPRTQERQLRPSAQLYAEICRSNRLPVSVEIPPAPPVDEEPAGRVDLR